MEGFSILALTVGVLLALASFIPYTDARLLPAAIVALLVSIALATLRMGSYLEELIQRRSR